MRAIATTVALKPVISHPERNRKKAISETTDASVRRSSARGLVEVSNEIRAAVSELAAKTRKANGRSPSRHALGKAVDVHLKGIAQQVRRIEELARELCDKM